MCVEPESPSEAGSPGLLYPEQSVFTAQLHDLDKRIIYSFPLIFFFHLCLFGGVLQEVLCGCLCSLIKIRISGTAKGGRRRKITIFEVAGWFLCR